MLFCTFYRHDFVELVAVPRCPLGPSARIERTQSKDWKGIIDMSIRLLTLLFQSYLVHSLSFLSSPTELERAYYCARLLVARRKHKFLYFWLKDNVRYVSRLFTFLHIYIEHYDTFLILNLSITPAGSNRASSCSQMIIRS